MVRRLRPRAGFGVGIALTLVGALMLRSTGRSGSISAPPMGVGSFRLAEGVHPTTTVAVSRSTVGTEPPQTSAAPSPTTSASVSPPIVEAVEPVAPVAPPATVLDATVTAPSKPSPCHDERPGAVMTIAMADISYSCSVYAGGQSVIDEGVATLVTDRGAGPELATRPGAAGALWIAGHRSSHGGPFAVVPSLADGAIVAVADGSITASYRVVGRVHVKVRGHQVVDASGQASELATETAVLRADLGATGSPRLVLQTCDADNFNWMIYADLIEG